MANKAVKYRIYPDDEQQVLISKTFGCCRKIWNLMLGVRRDTGIQTTPAQYKDDYPYLKEVDALALSNEQMALQKAFANFYGNPRHFKAPRFKSRKHTRMSYTTSAVNNNIRIEKGKLRLPKLGWIKCKVHRKIPSCAKIKSVTVLRNGAGRYFASVLYEYDFIEPEPVKVNSSVGLDYSSPYFYVDSDGNQAGFPKPYREAQNKLARAQRKLSRMVKDSSNYIKQLRKIGRLYQRIADIRKDWIEKRSTEIANQYDLVGLETLDMHAQAQTLHLGKAVYDNSYGMFCSRLRNKMEERGKYIMLIDTWYPSSKLCRECGYVYKGLALGQSRWVCPNCGQTHERDAYAAETIRLEALRLYSEQAA